MRSMLVAIDDTPAGTAAVEFALALAKRLGAAVTGVSVLDVASLTAREPGGIGTDHYRQKGNLARIRQARARIAREIELFGQTCATRGVPAGIIEIEGSPGQEMHRAAAAHDAIVIGHDSNFRGEPVDGLARTVEQVLNGNPRPLLITPATAGREPGRVLIAYDGSVPAARTLQIFTLLGLGQLGELHVIAVNAAQDVAQRCLQQASGYLALYGLACSTHAIASTDDPAELITAQIQRLGAGMLVMGAYGHRGWRETLLGSCTTRLLSECPATLFVHH